MNIFFLELNKVNTQQRKRLDILMFLKIFFLLLFSSLYIYNAEIIKQEMYKY